MGVILHLVLLFSIWTIALIGPEVIKSIYHKETEVGIGDRMWFAVAWVGVTVYWTLL